MRILNRLMSDDFALYHGKCINLTATSPSWISDSEVPYGKIRWRRYEGETTPTIIINPALHQAVFESTAAHELSYMVQYWQGYPQVLSARGSGLGQIASGISDLVTDPDADNRLKEYNLWTSTRFDEAYERTIIELPQKARPEHDKPVTCPPKRSPVLVLDWRLKKKGAVNGQDRH